MPSDKFWDDYYEAIDNATYERKENLRRDLVVKFSKMSLEKKVKFLIDKYIEDKVSEQG